MLQWMTLLMFLSTAVVNDRQSLKIPNRLLAVGAINGFLLCACMEGVNGVIEALSGAVLPLILCGWLFALSMLGAGDVKLLIAVGTYLGAKEMIYILAETLLIGAGLSLVKLTDMHLMQKRVRYFWTYIRRLLAGYREAYVDLERLQASEVYIIHFSVPVLLAVIYEMLIHGITGR